jgi:two-component system, chemotaxis family, sensor kinase CheA
MDTADKELVAEFVVESQEGLANVETQMLAVEAAGENVEVDLVNAVFRTMHSIKGAAGFLGLDRIGALAHGLEEVLDDLRNREVMPSSELVSTILRAADFMKGLIDEIETSNEADVSPFVRDLQKLRPAAHQAEAEAEAETAQPAAEAAAEESAPEQAVAEEPAAETPATDDAPQTQLESPKAHLDETTREFLIECYENLDQMERDLIALEASPNSLPLLRNVFRTIHTVKGGAGFLGLTALEKLTHTAESVLSELRSGERPLTLDVAGALFATVDLCRKGLQLVETNGNDAGFDPQSAIKQLLALGAAQAMPVTETKPPVEVKPAVPAPVAAAPATAEAPKKPAAPKPESQPAAPAKAATPPSDTAATTPAEGSSGEKGHAAAGDTTIRVDVALLDKLMTRVGELVLARNQILQRANGLEDAAFVSTAQRLNLITTELQEGVMKTRMQPIGNVWAKFPRVVRDLSAQLGKQVRIEMEGKETELDKTIVEAIKDPLTHLVRNSIDHGIESPEVRRAAGKPEEGRLSLRAFHEGGQVIIEICDDGAGLNVDRIRQKAIERGIISADQASRMTNREAAQIILLPGFSTAEKVTSVSGRGVGMDVVKTNIERIGGMLDLQSHLGQGTTVRIKIPLTLAIIPALVITNGGDRYAIPQVSLLELVRLEGDQVAKGIEFVHGAPVYRLRGKLLPLVNPKGAKRMPTIASSISSCSAPTTGNSGWWSTRSTTPKKSS